MGAAALVPILKDFMELYGGLFKAVVVSFLFCAGWRLCGTSMTVRHVGGALMLLISVVLLFILPW